MIQSQRRRWLRFSIRTLLIAVTVFCVWLGYCANWKRQRSIAAAQKPVVNALSLPGIKGEIPFGLWVVREDYYLLVEVEDNCTGEDLKRLESLFPEAYVTTKYLPETDEPLSYPPDWERLNKQRELVENVNGM